MVSIAKIASGEAAPRRGGPKTPEGKECAKYNALKHGLRAKTVVLPDEDEAAFTELRDYLLADICPQGAVEEMVAEEIVVSYWRIQRSRRIERELLAWVMDSQLRSGGDENYALARAANHGFGTSGALRNLKTCETAIKREFMSFLHELQRLQAARLTGRPTTPLAVDIDITGNQSDRPKSVSADQPYWPVPGHQTPEIEAAGLAPMPPHRPQDKPATAAVTEPRHHAIVFATRLDASGNIEPTLGKATSPVGRPRGLKLRDYLSSAETPSRRAPKEYAFTFKGQLAASLRGDVERGRASTASSPAEEQPRYLDSDLTYGAWRAAEQPDRSDGGP
jgi:hypothetical protein